MTKASLCRMQRISEPCFTVGIGPETDDICGYCQNVDYTVPQIKILTPRFREVTKLVQGQLLGSKGVRFDLCSNNVGIPMTLTFKIDSLSE